MEFDVQGRRVTQINPGPGGDHFEFRPERAIKYSRIIGLTEICAGLGGGVDSNRADSWQIDDRIEVPNLNRQTIALREIIEAQEFVGSPSKLTLAIWGAICMDAIRVTHLASMPHLLIAGSTGTGKSVFINR